MKRIFLIALGIVFLTSCVSYSRIGDLTMISNRNIDSHGKYVLIKRNAEGIAKEENNDALERAIDAATKKYDGEYMMNVKIYIKDNGTTIKVVGDVWGFADSKYAQDHTFKVGNSIVWKRNAAMKKGKIVGLKDGIAVIEYISQKKKKHIEVSIEKLTKTEED